MISVLGNTVLGGDPFLLSTRRRRRRCTWCKILATILVVPKLSKSHRRHRSDMILHILLPLSLGHAHLGLLPRVLRSHLLGNELLEMLVIYPLSFLIHRQTKPRDRAQLEEGLKKSFSSRHVDREMTTVYPRYHHFYLLISLAIRGR